MCTGADMQLKECRRMNVLRLPVCARIGARELMAKERDEQRSSSRPVSAKTNRGSLQERCSSSRLCFKLSAIPAEPCKL